MDVENFGGGFVLQQAVPHGMHQMGLAQANATVNEKRVVQMPWNCGYVHGCRPGHAVGRTLHQGVEGEHGVEAIFGRARVALLSGYRKLVLWRSIRSSLH